MAPTKFEIKAQPQNSESKIAVEYPSVSEYASEQPKNAIQNNACVNFVTRTQWKLSYQYYEL